LAVFVLFAIFAPEDVGIALMTLAVIHAFRIVRANWRAATAIRICVTQWNTVTRLPAVFIGGTIRVVATVIGFTDRDAPMSSRAGVCPEAIRISAALIPANTVTRFAAEFIGCTIRVSATVIGFTHRDTSVSRGAGFCPGAIGISAALITADAVARFPAEFTGCTIRVPATVIGFTHRDTSMSRGAGFCSGAISVSAALMGGRILFRRIVLILAAAYILVALSSRGGGRLYSAAIIMGPLCFVFMV
jgi:hypothetical protein